jgi:hypothetical protein
MTEEKNSSAAPLSPPLPPLEVFETGSYYVAQAGLKLTILLPKAPPPPCAGITDVHHHTQALKYFFNSRCAISPSMN